MNQANCPECGTPVTEDLPGGLCPTCLINVARRSAKSIGATAAMPEDFRAPDLVELEHLFPELEILEMVGRGGMGAVYRVKQKNLDRIVALKVFLYRPEDPEFAARFQREARALAKLTHPNIVTVHDFGSRENIHYLIMEFVDGLNLRQITSEEKLSPEMALQMVPQLCDALQYAHDQGVIHRDIKPENLLLDTDGRIKIADFGLAKMTGNENMGTLTHTRQVMGTLNYMAPEQRERPTEVDHRADIYSLGVVIYEMLTGELPIGRFLPPSEKSQVDAGMDEVVMRALEKEPNRRYQQASEFKTGFESVGDSFSPIDTPVRPVKYEYDYDQDAQGGRLMIAIMSGREKHGNWRPGNPQWVFTMMGGSCLDVSQVEAPEVTINALTLMGGTEIIVAPDAEVDVDGLIIMGATVEKTLPYSGPKRQRIRVRSWGAMGGCEVRTAKPKTPVAPQKTSPLSMEHYRDKGQHQISVRAGLVMLFKLFATLVGLASILMFVLSGTHVVPHSDGKIAAFMCLAVCGFLWSALGYFRRIIGAGPENEEEETVKNYYSSSVIGSMIRMFAMLVGFACPALFVLSGLMRHDKEELRVAAFVCAGVCVAFYLLASFVEEFFYGKMRE